MLTGDYFKGYFTALNTIQQYNDSLMLQTDKDVHEERISEDEGMAIITSLQAVNNYLEEVRNNYRSLIKDLNDTQSKKNPS